MTTALRRRAAIGLAVLVLDGGRCVADAAGVA